MNNSLLKNRQLHPLLDGKAWVWVSRVLLILVILAHSSLYFSNTYPISEGWGANYAELLFAGKVPYRDFYYYLPPLSLWIDAVLWKLSFGSLLIFRAWRVVERVTIYVMIFNLLKRYFHHLYAFAGCALAAILCTGDVYDLLGDYNQTMALLAVLLLYCAIGFVDADILKKKLLNLFLGGLVIGCMFLNKQTIFLGTFLTYFVAITAFCIVKEDKHYWQYILAVAVGVLLPLGIASVYLLLNGAFMPFVEQVFLNVDGKGSLFRIIVEGVSARMTKTHIWAIIFSSIGLILFSKVCKHMEKTVLVNLLRGILVCFTVVLVTVICYLYQSDVESIIEVLKLHRRTTILIICSLVPYVGAVIFELRNRKMNREHIRLLKYFAIGLCSVAVILFVVLNQNFAKNLYTKTSLFSYIQGDLSLWCMLSMVVLMVWNLLRCGKEENAEHFFFIACAGFSLFYAGIMASGASAGPAHIVRIALPYLLCVVFSLWIPSKLVSTVVKGGTWIVCIVLCMVCVAQKVECSYSWWGSSMEPISEKSYTTDIPALKGITMSEDRKFLYETVTKLIEENSDKDAVIWGYPHNKLFNILTERYNMKTFVPVLFYDVTADQYVLQELEMLQENLPDIVVWQYLPNVLTVHEEVFRDGELLKHREIESFFAETLPEKYTLLGAVKDVSVYKLNDETPAVSEPIFDNVFKWYSTDGVFPWEDNFSWCEQSSTWIVRSPLPAAANVQMYLYLVVGDGSSVGNVDITINGEKVHMVEIKKGSQVVEFLIDVELLPGDNEVRISTDTPSVEDDCYYKLFGLYFRFPK